MKKLFQLLLFCLFSITFFGCSEDQSIVNNVEERDANEIIVFLAAKNINAYKVKATSSGTETSIMWNIYVDPAKAVEAMAVLSQTGLPRKQGQTLLQLFAKEGLMTSETQDKIRYQAGLEEQLKNTIRKIDGVIDVDVQISFPQSEELIPTETTKPKIKASVYVKHQGTLDDPNNQLETKIKKLVAGSIEGLDYENVAVISDRSLLADINLRPSKEVIGIKASLKDKEYVSLWSIVMTKSSAMRFRLIFFTMIILIFGLAATTAYILYRFHPIFNKGKEENKGE